MLRELNETEMEMVSGGSLIKKAREDKKRRDARKQGGTYYRGVVYSSPEAADIARQRYEGLEGQYGSNSSDSSSGLSVGTGGVVLPDPNPTVDPVNPTASHTITLSGIQVRGGNGVSVTAGSDGSTVGVNVTVGR